MILGWAITFFIVALYLVVEFAITPKASRVTKFWIRVGVILSLIISVQIINVVNHSVKFFQQQRQIKLEITDELKSNCNSLYVLRTCLNQKLVIKQKPDILLYKLNMVDSLRNKKLQIQVRIAYAFLESLSDDIKNINASLYQVKKAITELDKNVYGNQFQEKKEYMVNSNLSDSEVVEKFFGQNSVDYTSINESSIKPASFNSTIEQIIKESN